MGDDETSTGDEGDYALDDAFAEIEKRVPRAVLTGIYRVNGDHTAEGGGTCTGFAFVKFGDNPLQSVVGWVVVGGLIITASGLIIAFRSRPIPIVRRTP